MAHSEGSFVRWQSITITQLGYAVNLFLTFATASLGFALSLVKDSGFQPGCWGRCFFDFSLLAFAVSILLGSLCVLNRLKDFRLTKDIAKLGEKLLDSTHHPC